MSQEFGRSVTIDQAGNIIVVGKFAGTVDFDPSASVFNLTSSTYDVFAAKYDSNGNFLWATCTEATTSNSIDVLDVTSDIWNNIYLVGYYQSTVDFYPGAGSHIATSSGLQDAYVLKLKPNGDYDWSFQFGASGSDRCHAITTDADGNLYITGQFSGTTDFDPSMNVANETTLSNTDMFLASIDTGKVYNWSQSMGGATGGTFGKDIDILGNGNILLGGEFSGTTEFNPGGTSFSETSSGHYDAFFGEYNPTNGVLVQFKTFGSADFQGVNSLKVSSNGDFLLGGIFQGTVDFDPTPSSDTYTANGGGTDAYISKYDANWNYLWTAVIDGAGYDDVKGVDLGANGEAYLTGVFEGANVDLDPGVGSYTVNTNGYEYPFVSKIIDCTPSSSTDVIIACDSLVWIDGQTYYTSNNTATYTLVNASGCDSVITLDLTINQTSYATITETACDSYYWNLNGNMYFTSGSYVDTITNTVGCDSVVTLNLTINQSYSTDEFVTACDSYDWVNGMTYGASGFYTTVLQSANGCDSVVNLFLTINNSSSGIDAVTACDSFTWIDGNTYTASNNTATYTLTNATGCDSTVTLDLTILNSSSGVDVVSACDSYTWIDGNIYTASNNTATYTLTNAAGCDSIVTLDLTIQTVNINVTDNSPTLIAQVNGATYQWLDCQTSLPISGANNQNFTATTNGDYAVIITENGCVDTSDCYNVKNIGLLEAAAFDSRVEVFPNPSNGQFKVDFNSKFANVTIYDLTGKVVWKNTIWPNQWIEMKNQPEGIYVIQVEINGQISQHKLIITHE